MGLRGTHLLGATSKAGPSGPIEPHKALTAIAATTLTWDLAADAITWGPNAAALFGLPPVALWATGRSLAEAIEPEGGMTRAEMIRGAPGADAGFGVPYRIRYGLRCKADRLIVIEETGRWFADAHGRPAVAHGLVRSSRMHVCGDAMTAGLKARAALLAQIMDDVLEAQRSRHAMTLVVGAFEPDDERDGQMAEIARRLRPILRRRDRFVPYAPNRFALALVSCPATEAEAAVKRLLTLVEAKTGTGAPDEASTVGRLRIGAASAPDHAIDAPELLRRAEEALGQALRQAKPSFSLYRTNDLIADTTPCGTSPDALLDALNGRMLVLARHTILDAQSRAPALVRAQLGLRMPDGRTVPAGDFAVAAQACGLSTLLDARRLELAADHLAAEPDDRIMVDIAAETLAGSEWLTVLAAHLGARPGIESRLIVGIPETALRGMPATRGRLDAMKALGVGIALRGFGTGYATCKHLRALPLDMVRIGGAFVQNAARSTDDRLFLRTLVDLAQHFGIATMAEWVEDDDIAGLLAGWGVDYLQGPACGAVDPAPSAGQRAGRQAA